MATKKNVTSKSAAAKPGKPAKGTSAKSFSKSSGKTIKGTKSVAKAAGEKRVKVAVKTGPRHPRGRLLEAHGSKEALAKTLAATIARSAEDTNVLESQLKKASNKQLLRLARVSEAVKKKYGNREKLIAAIGTAQKKSKDTDYIAKLDTYSLPQLLALATSAERAAHA